MFSGKCNCACAKWYLSLAGSINFACKNVVPGGAFLSRLIQLCHSVHELHYYAHLNKNNKKGPVHFFCKGHPVECNSCTQQ